MVEEVTTTTSSRQDDSGRVMDDMEEGSSAQGLRQRRNGNLRPGKKRESHDEEKLYIWQEFAPRGWLKRVRWLLNGASDDIRQSDEQLQQNLASLARMLVFLRQYEENFGMPNKGGPHDQEHILRVLCGELYKCGTPIWALAPVMEQVAEGLTGKRGAEYYLLPRKAFIYTPSAGTTIMFRMERGFCFHELNDMEQVAVRLASFASNTCGVHSLKSRSPINEELSTAVRTANVVVADRQPGELATEILDLGSKAEGLHSFVNSRNSERSKNPVNGSDEDEFWEVEDSTVELFCRLAAVEAMESIKKIKKKKTKELYSRNVTRLFHWGSSASACVIWYGGSWWDMLVAGFLGVIVANVGQSDLLTRQERLIVEAAASLIVGLLAGWIALQWPENTCFVAMALGGVLDILQGFRVVWAVIEIMSKYTVPGSADFLEGLLFTAIIALFLFIGQSSGAAIHGGDDEFPQCNNGINEWWYFLFVPIGGLSWSGLFQPVHKELPLMIYHACLAYAVSWGVSHANLSANIANFIAAMTVCFSAGIISRFTGRQALGNTAAGLYVLLPGAYLVESLFSTNSEGDYFAGIILRAVTIGLGGWTGTILCSPTVLGSNRGLMRLAKSENRERSGAMLYF